MPKKKDLDAWQRAGRKAVHRSSDSLTRRLLEASKDGEFVSITYLGGLSPRAKREVLPQKFFKVPEYGDTIYMEAFCSLRGETRNFRLDRVSIDKPPTKRKRAKGSDSTHSGKTKSISQGAPDRNLIASENEGSSANFGWIIWLGAGAILWALLS
jgi:predicted DNA-binding transcriptional regulator YafY